MHPFLHFFFPKSPKHWFIKALAFHSTWGYPSEKERIPNCSITSKWKKEGYLHTHIHLFLCPSPNAFMQVGKFYILFLLTLQFYTCYNSADLSQSKKNSFHSSAKWKYNICILIEKIAWGGREEEDRKEWRVKGRVEQRLEGRNTFSSSFLDKCLWLETHATAHLAIKSHLTSKYNWALNLQINGTVMLISKVKLYAIPCLKAIMQ